MKIIKSELEYTGGNIWCAWGELEDGTIFSGSDNMGFILWDSDVVNILGEDCPDPTCLSPSWDGSEVYIKGYTDDDSLETFELWKQIYDQHAAECVDIDYLRGELYEIFNADRPRIVSLTLTGKQLEILRDIMQKAKDEYIEAIEDSYSLAYAEQVTSIFYQLRDK